MQAQVELQNSKFAISGKKGYLQFQAGGLLWLYIKLVYVYRTNHVGNNCNFQRNQSKMELEPRQVRSRRETTTRRGTQNDGFTSSKPTWQQLVLYQFYYKTTDLLYETNKIKIKKSKQSFLRASPTPFTTFFHLIFFQIWVKSLIW